MTIKKMDESMQTAEANKFSKEQILSAKKYNHLKDVVNVVLKYDQTYELEEVDNLIDDFMKGKVN